MRVRVVVLLDRVATEALDVVEPPRDPLEIAALKLASLGFIPPGAAPRVIRRVIPVVVEAGRSAVDTETDRGTRAAREDILLGREIKFAEGNRTIAHE